MDKTVSSRAVGPHAGFIVSVCLDGARSFLCDPDRHLREATAIVDHLLQVVPHKVALNRDEILHRTAARERGQAIHVPLELILRQAEPLTRDLLRALRQGRARLSYRLQVLGRLAGQFLRLWRSKSRGFA